MSQENVIIDGCPECPCCDENDMGSGYGCQLMNIVNCKPKGHPEPRPYIKEDTKTFMPVTPDWCPIKNNAVTLKLKES